MTHGFILGFGLELVDQELLKISRLDLGLGFGFLDPGQTFVLGSEHGSGS